MINLEEFKKISFINENYLIDKQGNIYSCYSKRILKPTKNKRGYLYISINNKKFKVHRLVALTYIDNPNNYPQVNHIDGNKLNNDVENLEWCSSEYNRKHASKLGLLKCKKHVKEMRSRLDVTRKKCLELRQQKLSYEKISKILNCSIATVCNRINKENNND